MSGALGPSPRVGVVVEGPGHDIGLIAALKLFAFVVVIMGHVQPKQCTVRCLVSISRFYLQILLSLFRYWHFRVDIKRYGHNAV